MQVLQAVENARRTKRDKMLEQGASLVAHLAEQAAPRPGGEIGPDDLTLVGESFLRILDPVNGGIGRAPKFPNAPIFRFLQNEFFRRRDPRMREAVRALLDALCAGGIYDHLGGGFARYSTDAEWHVPHFEKMLYDNAQILELLALAHAETPSPVYEARARETFAWLMREMRVGDAFASSQDADQAGEEGLFYVWSAEEIDAFLGADAPAFKAAYDVRRGGNWEGRNVLRRVTPPGDADEERRLQDARGRLFAAREARPRPPLDDKVLADWNGLTISALARAAAVFAAPEFLEAARAAFAFVWNRLRDAWGRLAHSWRADRIGAPGMLDDYAALTRAALALFEATGVPFYLDAATSTTREAQALFGAADGGLYLTAEDASDAPAITPTHRPRRRDTQRRRPDRRSLRAALSPDSTEAASGANSAERLIRAFAGAGPQELAQSPLLLAAADMLERGGCVAVEGPLEDPLARKRLAHVALAAPDPALTVLRLDRALWPSGAPGGRPAPPSPPAAMLCRGQTCGLPARTVEALRAELERLN